MQIPSSFFYLFYLYLYLYINKRRVCPCLGPAAAPCRWSSRGRIAGAPAVRAAPGPGPLRYADAKAAKARGHQDGLGAGRERGAEGLLWTGLISSERVVIGIGLEKSNPRFWFGQMQAI